MSDQPDSNNPVGWNAHTAPGSVMGDPVPQDIATGISDDQYAAILGSFDEVHSALKVVADARQDADAAVAAANSTIALVTSTVNAVLPILKTVVAAKTTPQATSALGGLNNLAGLVDTLKRNIPGWIPA